MDNRTQIKRLHETLNDVFMDLQGIQVCDEHSRESKQSAILGLVNMRRIMENIGLNHCPVKGSTDA